MDFVRQEPADVSLSNFHVESLLSLPAHKAHPVGSVEAQVKEAATVQFCQPPPAYLHVQYCFML